MSNFTKRFYSFLMAVAMIWCMCAPTAAAATPDETMPENTADVSPQAVPELNYDESGSVGPIAIGTSASAHFKMKPYTGFSRTLYIQVTPGLHTAFSGNLYGTVSHNGKHLCSFELNECHTSFEKKFTLPASGDYTLTVKNETDSNSVFVLAWWVKQ